MSSLIIINHGTLIIIGHGYSTRPSNSWGYEFHDQRKYVLYECQESNPIPFVHVGMTLFSQSLDMHKQKYENERRNETSLHC